MNTPRIGSYEHRLPDRSVVYYVCGDDGKWRVTSVRLGPLFDGVNFIHARLRPDHEMLQAFDTEEELLDMVEQKIRLERVQAPRAAIGRLERAFA